MLEASLENFYGVLINMLSNAAVPVAEPEIQCMLASSD
jgi:hypothetical protein